MMREKAQKTWQKTTVNKTDYENVLNCVPKSPIVIGFDMLEVMYSSKKLICVV